MTELEQYFNGDELAASVFKGKYALPTETTPDDMHKRLAKEFARVEADEIQKKSQLAPEVLERLSEYGRKRKDLTEEEVYELFKDFKYIVPQGSVMSILGSGKVASLSNCFVVGQPEGDSYGAIMHKDQQLAQLMKRRGGCIEESTPVIIEGKGIIPIKEVEIGDKILSYNISTGEDEYKAIKDKYYTEVNLEDQIEYNYNNGVKLKTSKKHPVLNIFEDTSYKTYDEIELNKTQNKSRNITGEWAEGNSFDEKAWLIGFHLGDGTSDKSGYKKNSVRVRVAGNYEGTILKYKEYVEAITKSNTQVRKSTRKDYISDVWEYNSTNKSNQLLIDLLDGQTNNKTYNWFIPKYINKNNFISFLGGIIDADGYVTKSGRIDISLCSKQAISDMCNFLTFYGQPFSVNEYKPKRKNESTLYSIHILKYGPIYNEIKNHIHNEHKKNKINTSITYHSEGNYITNEEIEYLQKIKKTVFGIKELNDKQKMNLYNSINYAIKNKKIGLALLKILLDNNLISLTTFNNINSRTKLKSVIIDNSKKHQYIDIEVEDNNNYYAGYFGMVNIHNCGIDISTLRPSGAKVTNAAGTSTGAASFMERYSNTTREVAQCIMYNTKVLTNDGEVEIQDIKPNIKVWTRIGWVSVINKIKSGIKKVYKLTSGKDFIITSEDHIFSTPNGEVRLKNLNVGDIIHKINKPEESTFLINDILFESKIDSIEYYGEEETYDLSLEKEHFFGANGFYVHNSGRRGALMISLDVRHPDIEDFVTKKQDPTKVTGANVSVFLRDDFMQAVKEDKDYLLRWPCENESLPNIEDFKYNELVEIEKEFGVSFYKRIKAKELWDTIIKCAHNTAEPGIMFLDKHLDRGTDSVYEKYKPVTTNPCSEISMSPYDACRLIANNLYSYVINPFTESAYFDFDLFYQKSYEQQRLADDLVALEMEHIDRILNKIKSDPEPEHVKRDEYELWEKIKDMTASSRRTGSGFTALGDALAALNLKYDSDEALAAIDKIMATKMEAELDCTVDLAILRGTFEGWDVYNEYEYDDKNGVTGTNPFFQFILDKFPEQANRMMKYGRRNVSFSTTAPTGSLSILTQTTSGIEPIFMVLYYRRKKVNPGEQGVRVDFVDQNGDSWTEYPVLHPKFITWYLTKFGEKNGLSTHVETKTHLESLTKDEIEELLKLSPWYGSTANDINWLKRVEIQGIVQNYTTHSISSTINLPNNVSVEEVSDIYMHSWEQGLKGVTVYRDGCRTGVLISKPEQKEDKFEYIDAIKRPKELPCILHHVRTDKTPFTVVVGLLDEKPYEVFAVPTHIMKDYKTGILTKKSRGVYNLTCSLDDQYVIYNNLVSTMSDEQEAITRLVSGMLRHRANVKFIVEQLLKTEGHLSSFTKAIARVLKNYIPDGEISTLSCEKCGSKNVIFEEGCSICKECGHSKCG